jgi:hypothetical protein
MILFTGTKEFKIKLKINDLNSELKNAQTRGEITTARAKLNKFALAMIQYEKAFERVINI